MRRSVTYGLYGVVLAGLVGGTLTWATVDKSVTLVVDGQRKAVHTLSGTVAGALADAGYRPTSHDIVAPAPSAAVKDGGEIVLRRGRLLQLTVDGQKKQVWTWSPNLSDALGDLGFDSSTFTSVSRSKRLPLTPTSIDVRTPKHVTLVHDNASEQLVTTAASVGQVLSDAGLSLAPTDTVSAPAFSAPTDGLTLTVHRVNDTRVTEHQPIPFGTTQQPDPTLVQGRTQVVTPGANGSQDVTFAVVYVDGILTGKTQLSATVTANPTQQVEKVGTAAPAPVAAAPAPASSSRSSAPAAAAAPPAAAATPGSAQAIAQQILASRGMGGDQFSCLVSLWNKESGWRTNAANSSGAYGIPQALPGSKMASAGPNWQTDATTQITWGLGYITGRYGTPCAAWAHSQATNWY